MIYVHRRYDRSPFLPHHPHGAFGAIKFRWASAPSRLTKSHPTQDKALVWHRDYEGKSPFFHHVQLQGGIRGGCIAIRPCLCRISANWRDASPRRTAPGGTSRAAPSRGPSVSKHIRGIGEPTIETRDEYDRIWPGSPVTLSRASMGIYGRA